MKTADYYDILPDKTFYSPQLIEPQLIDPN